MKLLKEKKYVPVLLLALTFVLFVGISFAFVTFSVSGKKTYTITGGELSLSLDETNNELNIGEEYSIPVTDYEGMKQDGYNFSIKNNGGIDLNYSVYIENTEENTMTDTVIKYNYINNVDNKNVRGNLSDLKDRLLVSGRISKGETITYNLKFWINIDATNEEIVDKVFSVKLKIIGNQIIHNYYVDNTLNGAEPVLGNNLVPVTISNNGTVTKADIQTEWYNYSERKWANAVILEDSSVIYNIGDVIPESNIESYFVWIPKYSYQLWDLGNYNSLTNIEQKEQEINIRFGLRNTNSNNSGECTTSIVSSATESCNIGDYMTHPAFISMDTNGLWVGKFETGYRGANSIETSKVNGVSSNMIQIKPNIYSWRSIDIANAFTASYNYLRNEDSHMMKNTEWAAVLYLSHSKYGRCDNGVCSEISPVGSEQYNSTNGYLTSTTGNITGIYNMNGGLSEYVMGVASDSSGVPATNIDLINSKYYDLYAYTTSNTNYNYSILGDAIRELGPFENQTTTISSWYGSSVNMPTSESPYLYRGNDGMFSSSNSDGIGNENITYRIVLVPQIEQTKN